MNRVCLTKDGKLIEMQSGGKEDRSFNQYCDEENKIANNKKWDALEAMRLNALRKNALNAGYAEADIEVKWVTDEELEVIMDAQKQRDLDARPYTEKRKAEYPPMADYLDGIVKGDQAQIDKYIADCKVVKAKYPKE